MEQNKAESHATWLTKIRTNITEYIKWFTRIPIVVLFLIIILNAIIPNFIELISGLLHFPQPSLMSLIGVSILFFLLERIVIIEGKLEREDIKVFETKEDAYDAVVRNSTFKKVKTVDILEFSGVSAWPVLKKISEHWPQSNVRLLLYDPEYAKQFDADWADWNEGHVDRIRTTLNQIRVLENSCLDKGFHIDVGFYNVPPSLAAVIVDNKLISVSWYRTYIDQDSNHIVRLRGHDSATVVATGEGVHSLIPFAKGHFNALWAARREARNKSNSPKVAL